MVHVIFLFSQHQQQRQGPREPNGEGDRVGKKGLQDSERVELGAEGGRLHERYGVYVSVDK